MTVASPVVDQLDSEAAQIGSVFVSNYPPYSVWDAASVPMAHQVLQEPGDAATPLGLYVHIPFCRKRCKFCYFRVFTDKNSSEIRTYLDLVAHEVERYASLPAVAGRELDFVYFGGGTPSYISADQLSDLAKRLKAAQPWDGAREVAFECEPGTLTQSKLAVIRDVGVTRLSLGIENFDDGILRENGRAHVSDEIYRVRPWIRALDFPQLNIDLIAGMVGETWDTWKTTVERAIEYEPDSVTLYQMEL
ncbi:MAG: radical SAM protein, partial [Thermoanaerobaculia bacterium]|nr:radical SAM protein [Thermoanaerobaculia bacterium]